MATIQVITCEAVEDFIREVRAALERKGWTISKLAAEARVGRPYLHRVLSGEQEPSLRSAAKIGRPLGLSVRTVVTRKKTAKSA